MELKCFSFRSSSVLYAKILIYDKNKNDLSVQKWGSGKRNYIWYTHWTISGTLTKKNYKDAKLGEKNPRNKFI